MYRPGFKTKTGTPQPAVVVQPQASTNPETSPSWAVGSVAAVGVADTHLAPKSAARDPIGEVVGSYRIVRALGKGGCGAVWLAEHTVIGTKVAIKILRPEVVNIPGVQERFITEARASSTIPSSHVAKYTDLGVLPTGEPYAIMEYLEGETVHARIARQGQLSIDDALAVTRQAAETLALAHEASIIHRDIKPENIFLVGSGINIKVLDFGIAKLIGDAMQTAHQTATGAFVGTPAYCAPEQLLGTATSEAVDMYALGTTLYEMLAGELPYDTASPEFLVTKVSDPAPRVREVRATLSERLDALVASMLAANPTERPRSMRALLAELDRIAEPLPGRARRLKLRVALAIAVVAAIAGVATVLAIRDDAPPPPAGTATAPVVSPVTATPIEPSPNPAREQPPAPAAAVTARPEQTPSGSAAPPPVRRPAVRTAKPPVQREVAGSGAPDVIIADPFQ